MRTRLTLSLSLSVAALAVLPGCAGEVAPKTAAGATRTDVQPSEQDRSWMDAIHQGNLAEVQAGRLAQGRGSARRVKAIGGMFVADYTALDTKVTQAAAQLGIQLPTSPTAEQNKAQDRLRDSKGRRFDRGFLAGRVRAHKQVLAATKREISKGESQTVTSLAKATAPTLREHLALLRRAQAG